MALQCMGKYKNYEECYSIAVESLESGAAFQSLNKLLQLT
jgi:anthranilate phosphoribosyltransferase